MPAVITVGRLWWTWKVAFSTNWQFSEFGRNVAVQDIVQETACVKIVSDPTWINGSGVDPTPDEKEVEKEEGGGHGGDIRGGRGELGQGGKRVKEVH
jgi:hypothetical protein